MSTLEAAHIFNSILLAAAMTSHLGCEDPPPDDPCPEIARLADDALLEFQACFVDADCTTIVSDAWFQYISNTQCELPVNLTADEDAIRARLAPFEREAEDEYCIFPRAQCAALGAPPAECAGGFCVLNPR